MKRPGGARPADIRCFSAKKVPNSFDAKHVRDHVAAVKRSNSWKPEKDENISTIFQLYSTILEALVLIFFEVYYVDQMVFSIYCLVPVVPHKAVVEVSKIGNL